MTTKDAINRFEKQLSAAQAVLDSGFGIHPGENNRIYQERKEMAEVALEALRFYQDHVGRSGKPTQGDKIRAMSNMSLARLIYSIMSRQRKTIIEQLRKAGIPANINIVEVPMMTIAMHKKWLDEIAEENGDEQDQL